MNHSEHFEQKYSQAILSFISYVKILAKDILANEMHITVKNSRFQFKSYSYPLKIVVFEHPSRLGYFHSEFFEIGIHKKMLFATDDILLKNLIRHELAHYYCFIKFGNSISHHGKEYHDICRNFRWGKEVYEAYTQLTEKDFLESPSSNKIFSKIQKLLSLATSPHPEESEAATLKANELLIKYNLDANANYNEQEMGLKRLLFAKRATAKMQTISSILRCFFVYPVISYSKVGVYLEIFGEDTNLNIAEYVGLFLDNKLEEIWLGIQKKHPNMRGLTKKNSFFRGISKGYVEKIKSLQEKSDNSKALLVIEKVLQEHVSMAYPKLSKSSSSSKNCQLASDLGKKEGQNLNIHQGISNKNPGNITLSIT